MNTITLLILALTVIVQNASFTLVSRARNSGSYLYNALASVFSNGIWILVINYIMTKPGDVPTAIVYVIAATIGSVLMQWVAIKYLEKKKPASVQIPSKGRMVIFMNNWLEETPAVITKVHDDARFVDLYVFKDDGYTYVGSELGVALNNWKWPVIK